MSFSPEIRVLDEKGLREGTVKAALQSLGPLRINGGEKALGNWGSVVDWTERKPFALRTATVRIYPWGPWETRRLDVAEILATVPTPDFGTPVVTRVSCSRRRGDFTISVCSEEYIREGLALQSWARVDCCLPGVRRGSLFLYTGNWFPALVAVGQVYGIDAYIGDPPEQLIVDLRLSDQQKFVASLWALSTALDLEKNNPFLDQSFDPDLLAAAILNQEIPWDPKAIFEQARPNRRLSISDRLQ
jgi:hypothetical protein